MVGMSLGRGGFDPLSFFVDGGLFFLYTGGVGWEPVTRQTLGDTGNPASYNPPDTPSVPTSEPVVKPINHQNK